MIIDMPTVSMGNSGSVLPADKVSYDNTTSGLEAENVQDAIDEVNSNLGNVRFGIDGDGNYGYYGADDSFVPFSRFVYVARILTCGNNAPTRMAFYNVTDIAPYFVLTDEGDPNNNNPAMCRITVMKKMKAKITFSIDGRNNGASARRILKFNDTTIYDQNISETSFRQTYPGGAISVEKNLEEGDYFLLGVGYYSTAFKSTTVRIDPI